MKTKTREEFIEDAIRVHGLDKFGYDKVVYINRRTKVKIDCLVCEVTFEQSPDVHLKGHGCGACHRAKDHGLSGTVLYTTWKNIKGRCYNPNNKDYECYGGRGIKIADEWKNDPVAFCNYVEKLDRPTPQHNSLDRWPDNNGNYEPGNLRWATKQEQIENKSKPNQRKIEALEKQIEELKAENAKLKQNHESKQISSDIRTN